MDLHVVEVEVLVEWEDDDRLTELMEALAAHPELREPAVGADLHRPAIGVTVTVEARDPATARAIAERVIAQKMAALGFARAGEPHPLNFEAARRAHMEARKQEALEAMARGIAHPVTVEVALDWDEHEHLGALLAAMDVRPEFLWPPVGANLGERVISVTVMVRAGTERAAQEIATVALLDEMQKLGLVGD